MIKPTARSPLLPLAVIGIVLYLAVVLVSSLPQSNDAGLEALQDRPAVSKEQAAQQALRFIRQTFPLSSDYRVSTLYQSDADRSGYLQKEDLAGTYAQRFGAYPLDYYEVEVNDNTSKTTYYIDVNFTDLSILGWESYIPRSIQQPAAAAGPADPQLIAEQTLRSRGYTLKDWERIEPDPQRHPSGSAAADSSRFVYQSKSLAIGEAKLQLAVTVRNGSAAAFHASFAIPASFLAWQEAQDKNAATMTRISLLLSLIMALASFYIVFRFRKEITFRRGLLLTAVFLAIYIANNFNMVPALRTAHSNGPSQLEAMFNLWFLNILIGLMAVSVYFALLAGRHLWLRQGWSPWPLWHEPSFGGQVRSAVIQGYLLCLFILGVQQTLFFGAEHWFDVWAVNDPSDSVLNMVYPAFFPLMAWAAAISEESVYRLFGIPFFMKLVRSRFIAVLIPSMIWALSHTQYPIYPVYTRFVEVTVIGLIFGYAFLKYGFMTVLFAHASMDSILMGFSLMDLGDWTHSLMGGFYIIFPGLAGWLIAWFHGKTKRRRLVTRPRLE